MKKEQKIISGGDPQQCSICKTIIGSECIPEGDDDEAMF